MPMIDSDEIKHGLLPVQQADARWRKAIADRRAASEAGADTAPLFEDEDQAYKAYLDALMILYGYVRASVNTAEGRRADQDE